MKKVENDISVSVDYKGTPQNGSVFAPQEGQQIPASIVQVDDENVITDINHQLAGGGVASRGMNCNGTGAWTEHGTIYMSMSFPEAGKCLPVRAMRTTTS